MAERLPEYVAPDFKLNIPTTGASAFEQAGRRVGPLYNEAATFTKEQGASEAGRYKDLLWPYNILKLYEGIGRSRIGDRMAEAGGYGGRVTNPNEDRPRYTGDREVDLSKLNDAASRELGEGARNVGRMLKNGGADTGYYYMDAEGKRHAIPAPDQYGSQEEAVKRLADEDKMRSTRAFGAALLQHAMAGWGKEPKESEAVTAARKAREARDASRDKWEETTYPYHPYGGTPSSQQYDVSTEDFGGGETRPGFFSPSRWFPSPTSNQGSADEYNYGVGVSSGMIGGF